MTRGAAAESLQQRDMRVVVFNMHGGLSQLESWDPKPGTKTGGPTRSIPTSVPGIHISELLPYTAKQMHHLCLLRGVNTSEDDHGKGAYMMLTGRRHVRANLARQPWRAGAAVRSRILLPVAAPALPDRVECAVCGAAGDSPGRQSARDPVHAAAESGHRSVDRCHRIVCGGNACVGTANARHRRAGADLRFVAWRTRSAASCWCA